MKEEPNVNTTVDSRGCKPDLTLLGTTWRHTGNQNIYVIMGYRWFGDQDIWLIEFERLNGGVGTPYSRSITNFTEDRQGKPRFEQVWRLNRGYTYTYVNQTEVDQLERLEATVVNLEKPKQEVYNKPHIFTKNTPVMGDTIEVTNKKLRNMDSLD